MECLAASRPISEAPRLYFYIPQDNFDFENDLYPDYQDVAALEQIDLPYDTLGVWEDPPSQSACSPSTTQEDYRLGRNTFVYEPDPGLAANSSQEEDSLGPNPFVDEPDPGLAANPFCTQENDSFVDEHDPGLAANSFCTQEDDSFGDEPAPGLAANPSTQEDDGLGPNLFVDDPHSKETLEKKGTACSNNNDKSTRFLQLYDKSSTGVSAAFTRSAPVMILASSEHGSDGITYNFKLADGTSELSSALTYSLKLFPFCPLDEDISTLKKLAKEEFSARNAYCNDELVTLACKLALSSFPRPKRSGKRFESKKKRANGRRSEAIGDAETFRNISFTDDGSSQAADQNTMAVLELTSPFPGSKRKTQHELIARSRPFYFRDPKSSQQTYLALYQLFDFFGNDSDITEQDTHEALLQLRRDHVGCHSGVLHNTTTLCCIMNVAGACCRALHQNSKNRKYISYTSSFNPTPIPSQSINSNETVNIELEQGQERTISGRKTRHGSDLRTQRRSPPLERSMEHNLSDILRLHE